MIKKELKPKTAASESSSTAIKSKVRYFEGIGRRKTAVARVRISPGHGKAIVNGKDLIAYFKISRLGESALSPLRELKLSDKFDVQAKIIGGGINAQAEALRHGLARALVLSDEELKKRLRVFGFLTRDSRMVERKKYGLKKARRAPQWKKR
ncbi:MAG: 30S ribosomal protein S9 [Candidatus Paceibacterota bacterium]|jgi:small subunit ribosomal protein S9